MPPHSPSSASSAARASKPPKSFQVVGNISRMRAFFQRLRSPLLRLIALACESNQGPCCDNPGSTECFSGHYPLHDIERTETTRNLFARSGEIFEVRRLLPLLGGHQVAVPAQHVALVADLDMDVVSPQTLSD